MSRDAPRDVPRVVSRILCQVSLRVGVQIKKTRHLALRACADVFHSCQFRIRRWKRWTLSQQICHVSCHGPKM